MRIHPPQPILFHDSTEVVQLTVNQLVPGSIPGRGASFAPLSLVAKVLPCKQGSAVRFCQGAPNTGL